MLLTFCLLFFTWSDPANTQTTKAAAASTNGPTPVSPSCVLVATPDYPVAAGQTVHLQCSCTSSSTASFSWHRLENQTWAAVSNGSDLTLSEAAQSGPYRCSTPACASQNYTVFIVALPPPAAAAAAEPIGVAALVFSLLALGVSGAVLFWLTRQKCDVPLPTPNTATDFPAPKTAPKVTVTQPSDDGDVYMNYSSASHAYTDLDPARMTVSSVYSTLS